MTFSPEVLSRHLAPLLEPSGTNCLAVALSGGADSAALLAALAELARTDPSLVVRALHVNHGLSAAANVLEQAARTAAAAAGVPFGVLTVTVAGQGGVEAAARSARYLALGAALAPGESLLTAHHREDQAETLLLQLFRGAGLKGLASMPAAAALGPGRLLRPLLELPRAALRDFAARRGLVYAADPMNEELRYERVFLREQVLPLLRSRWPALSETLARSARHLASAQQLIESAAGVELGGLSVGPALSIEGLLQLGSAPRAAVVREWLARHRLPMPPSACVARIQPELLRAKSTGAPCLRYASVELRAFGGYLYAFERLPALTLAGVAAPAPGASLPLGGLGALEARAAVGAGLVQRPSRPLTLGLRAGGERLRLRPGGPRRPLKDLLREARLPPWTRERAILVSDGELLAVVLPHATWIAAEHAAAPGAAGLELTWRDAPAVLKPLSAPGNFH